MFKICISEAPVLWEITVLPETVLIEIQFCLCKYNFILDDLVIIVTTHFVRNL